MTNADPNSLDLPRDDDAVRARHDKVLVNLSPTKATGELLLIQRKLARANAISTITNRLDLEYTVARLARTLTHTDETLDLIAHSADHVLQFADWSIKDDDVLRLFCERTKPHLQRYRALRLIGCGVASSDEGQRAMSAMQALLGIPVQGTEVLVSLDQFSDTGYTGGHLVTARRLELRGDRFP